MATKKYRKIIIPVLFNCVLSASAAVVDFTISSPQDGTTVTPNTPIDYSIFVEVTDTTGSQGLAGAVVDLVQGTNPHPVEIPLAAPASVQLTQFDRPLGISNPETGFVGAQVGPVYGPKDLAMIGGLQNTYGQAGTEMGTDPTVQTLVGHSGPELMVSGQMPAPFVSGTYTFALANGEANTLDSIQPLPTPSPVSPAAVNDSDAITFTVNGYERGDLDCNGWVDGFDISPFIKALTNPAEYASLYPNCSVTLADIDGNGIVDGFDISPFTRCVTQGGCP